MTNLIGFWKSPDELPTEDSDHDPITCYVIVKGCDSGNVRIEAESARMAQKGG